MELLAELLSSTFPNLAPLTFSLHRPSPSYRHLTPGLLEKPLNWSPPENLFTPQSPEWSYPSGDVTPLLSLLQCLPVSPIMKI